MINIQRNSGVNTCTAVCLHEHTLGSVIENSDSHQFKIELEDTGSQSRN